MAMRRRLSRSWQRGPAGTRPRPGARCARIVAIAGCLAAAGCAAPPDGAELAQRVDAIVAPLVHARQFSGAIVMRRGDRVVYARGFGVANHDAGVPFTPDTPSDGGSMAKTFTAAVVRLLAAEGRIELDAPVTRYVASYPHRQTTVRQLITHTNGLPPYYEFFDPHFAPGDVRTTSDLLRVVAAQAPAPSFEPGTRFEYSNLGFDAAAQVVEHVTGLAFDEVLRERVFARLGMHASFARPPRLTDWRGVRTMGHRWRDGAWQAWDVFDGEAFVGASNLYFSAADLARWAGAFALGHALPPALVEQGLQPERIGARPSPLSGLSWYCDTPRRRCHYFGTVNAFHAFAAWDRQRGEAVAFVSNGAMPPWTAVTLQRSLVDVLAGRALGESDTPGEPAAASVAPAHVVGRYRSPSLGVLTLEQAAGHGRLRMRIGDGLAFDVFQVGRAIFYVPGLDHWLAFSGERPPASFRLRSMYLDEAPTRVGDDAPGASR